MLTAALGLLLLQVQDPPRFSEKVDVARVLVDARAIDGAGRPLIGLTTTNFEVRIDGKPARVESAQWVTGALEARGGASGSSEAAPFATTGRLVVLLFQKDLDRSRITGLMRMLLNLRGFLDGFTAHDRLAVLSFDSRLRLWLDFTSDMERVREVLARNVLFGGLAPHTEIRGPSLREAFGHKRPERSYTIESALSLIANALQPLPGAKTVVLVGHGFGESGGGPGNTYEEARDALQRARASVFCLDVTNADYHTLEGGLQVVAEDTGGTFERTHLFARGALSRLASTLAGHYVLIVEKPGTTRGQHRIEVRLKGREGSVLARNAYVD